MHQSLLTSYSFFKSVKNVKTFVPNQHQNGAKMFLSFQMQAFSEHAWELALGYKCAFSVPPACELVIFSTKYI